MTSHPELAWTEEHECTLLAALRAGDESAYETLVRREGPRMLAVVRRYSTCEDEAQDAVQEAFVSAFKALDRFEGTARLHVHLQWQ